MHTSQGKDAPITKSASGKDDKIDWKAKADEYLDNWKRAVADLENYKKQEEARRAELVTFSKEVVLVKLLPVLDALEKALTHAPDDEKYRNWKQGMDHLQQNLGRIFAELGIAKIKAVGEKFDPALHESAEEVVSEQYPSGTVVEELISGYLLNGKVVRPAMVKVAK
jgi:molecular chaperone GrpE